VLPSCPLVTGFSKIRALLYCMNELFTYSLAVQSQSLDTQRTTYWNILVGIHTTLVKIINAFSSFVLLPPPTPRNTLGRTVGMRSQYFKSIVLLLVKNHSFCREQNLGWSHSDVWRADSLLLFVIPDMSTASRRSRCSWFTLSLTCCICLPDIQFTTWCATS